jgi:PEGA domain
MKTNIAVVLSLGLALAASAQENYAAGTDIVRTTNTWFTTNVTPNQTITEVAKPKGLRKVAIIVENRADASLNDQVAVLEDLVTSRVAGKGFAVISRDVTVNALKPYGSVNVNVSSQSAANASGSAAAAQTASATDSAKLNAAQSSALNLQAKDGAGNAGALNVNGSRRDSAELNAAREHAGKAFGNASANLDATASDSVKVAANSTLASTALDQALSDNTSALRLAQNLGADYILIPSITSYGTTKKAYNGNGIQTVNITRKLRVSYKIVEANEGGAVRGGSFVSESTTRDTANLQTESNDTLNDLLDDAAGQLADAIAESAKSLPAEVAKAGMVSFKVACSMTDPRQQPILIPAVSVSGDGKLIATNPPVALQPMDVTVELDGVALGSAPGEFKARPGLHKLRLSREGFDDWARTVNIYDGQTLRVALQMSAAGYANWKNTTDFLANLDANKKLTDAEVKQIEGLGEFLKNSHYRVDTKENVHINKSLY